jgi:hypothetical protein
MMPKNVNDPHFAVLFITCFPDLESENIKDLVLIPSWLASATDSAASPRGLGNPQCSRC